MKKLNKKIYGVLVGLLLCALFCSGALAADIPEITSNVNDQEYIYNWAKPIYSYLIPSTDKLTRVEYVYGGNLIIETLADDLSVTSKNSVKVELPRFGGFYVGEKYYYVLSGQNNPDEKDSQEVYRITKYDTKFNELDSASLYGANTWKPFECGSAGFAEKDNILYVRTNHEMYASDRDGLHHQANVTIQIDTDDMKVIDSHYEVDNIRYGYVSHSFNQRILVDDEDSIIGMDHGDAYPRSVVVGKYTTKAGSEPFYGNNWNIYDAVDVLPFQGESGVNYTGATVGGFEYSSTHYLTAGSSIPQDDYNTWDKSNIRNIFIGATSKDLEDNNVNWITNYSQSGTVSATNPQFVKVSADKFLVLWAEKEGYNYNGNIGYVFVDGKGNKIGQIQTTEGALSDCKPVIYKNKASWYVTNGNTISLYSVDTNGKLTKTDGPVPIYRLNNIKTGEHLYTSDANEVNELTKSSWWSRSDWESEGTGWYAPSKNNSAVYRLYSPVTGVHLYTTDKNEVNVLSEQGWSVDNGGAPLFYSGGTLPIFRLYHEGLRIHLLTSDAHEYEVLGQNGWNQEGTKLYAY